METLEAADDARDKGNHDAAEILYKQAMSTKISSMDDYEAIRVVEVSVYHLAAMYAEFKKAKQLSELLSAVQDIFHSIPKAKTAKIIRKLFDYSGVAGMLGEEQRSICSGMIDWARAEKRTFLRHRLQLRLAMILFDIQQHVQSLAILSALLREVRRLDDKALLVEILLLESRVFYYLRNPSKSRASLVAARTNANAIYCPPLLQAELDMQSGILHMEEKDSKTAYSYFYEAFEGFHSLGDNSQEAERSLKYMLLCKVMNDSGEEMNAVLASKSVLKYSSRVVDAMRSVSGAYKKRDTQEFNAVLQQYRDILDTDPVVASYLTDLYDTLLEKHLLKITEPYSVVQIDYVARMVKQEPAAVEAKLSQMILDKKLSAILDQKHNCLVLQVVKQDAVAAEEASKTIDNLSKVVDALFDKVAGKLVVPKEGAAANKDKGSPKKNKEEAAKSPKKQQK